MVCIFPASSMNHFVSGHELSYALTFGQSGLLGHCQARKMREITILHLRRTLFGRRGMTEMTNQSWGGVGAYPRMPLR